MVECETNNIGCVRFVRCFFVSGVTADPAFADESVTADPAFADIVITHVTLFRKC